MAINLAHMLPPENERERKVTQLRVPEEAAVLRNVAKAGALDNLDIDAIRSNLLELKWRNSHILL